MECPENLKKLYQEGRVIPFLGAGASMSVTWEVGGASCGGPSWSKMVDKAIEMMGFEHPELLRARGTDLQILEYFRAKYGNMQKLTNWLHHNMQPEDDVIRNSPIHRELIQLEKCGIIYTTNYDDYIERSWKLNGTPVKSIATERDLGDALGKVQVVKFHGDFNNPDKMVFSESDYETRIRLLDAMDLKLRSDILGKALLFVGYSFRDWNVSYIFRLMQEQFGKLPDSTLGKRAFIISPRPSDFERKLFEARGIEVIEVGASDITDETARILHELRS